MDYGLKIDITEEKIKMSIKVLEAILEKVLDHDELRICVSKMMEEEYVKLSTLLKEKAEAKKNSMRSVSPCPCGSCDA
jgi:uncharacterized protein (UPF0332 family)